MRIMIDPNSISKVLADAIVKKPTEKDELGYQRQIIQGSPKYDNESRIVFQTHPNFSYAACLGVLADRNASYPRIVVGRTSTNELGVGSYSYGDVLEMMPSGFKKYNDGYSWSIDLPARNGTSAHYLLDNKNVKTLFGQSIYSADGTGKIDLYKHNLKGVSGDNQVYISIPSSKNTPINSLTDLNTYLSNDDYYPATGVYKDGTTFYPIVFMTKSSNVWSVTYNKGTELGTALISAVAGTITDTVTTV